MSADLLADLPNAERAEVIAELAPADRVAIARMLLAKDKPNTNQA